jgi:predicted kinase
MKTLTIIRGVCGSGKSTLANALSANGNDTKVFEADMYFMKDVDGTTEYQFDHKHLPRAHAWCKEQTRQAMEDGCSVVVSNTFTRKWEIEPYIDLAKQFGYTVQLITTEAPFNNIHGVPSDVVQSMKDRFETLTLKDFDL